MQGFFFLEECKTNKKSLIILLDLKPFLQENET